MQSIISAQPFWAGPFRPPLHFKFKPGHIISAQPKIKTMIHHFSPTQDKDHDLSFQSNTKQEPLHTQNSPTPWFIISSQNSNNITVQKYNMSLTKSSDWPKSSMLWFASQEWTKRDDQKVFCYGLHGKSDQNFLCCSDWPKHLPKPISSICISLNLKTKESAKNQVCITIWQRRQVAFQSIEVDSKHVITFQRWHCIHEENKHCPDANWQRKRDSTRNIVQMLNWQ